MEIKTCEEYVLTVLDETQKQLESLQQRYIELLSECDKLNKIVQDLTGEEKTKTVLNEEAPRGC